ncbi:MAG: M56 family metallopeptidase, partial [Phycisphaerae bacterium]
MTETHMLDAMLDNLWRGALLMVPMTVLVHFAIRMTKCRATTRHALWALVLAWTVLGFVLPDSPVLRFDNETTSPALASQSDLSGIDAEPAIKLVSRPDASIDAVATVRPNDAGQVDASVDVSHVDGAIPRSTERLSVLDSLKSVDSRVAAVTQLLEDSLSSSAAALPEYVVPERLVPAMHAVEPPIDAECDVEPATGMARESSQSSFGISHEAVTPMGDAPTEAAKHVGDASPTSGGRSPGQRVAERSDRPPVDRGPSLSEAGGVASMRPDEGTALPEGIDSDATVTVSAPLPVGMPTNAEPLMPSGVQALGGTGGPSVQVSVQEDQTAWWLPVFSVVQSISQYFYITGASSIWATASDWLAPVRQVVMTLLNWPRIPTMLWAVGSFLLLCWYFIQVLLVRRRLRSAYPADRATKALVRQLSDQMGLAQPPVVKMMPSSFGPMIWCAGPLQLILPAELWAQLDADGRQAIVCHELAHVRRRDYWMRRMELFVSVIYWWHPIVWWVRRRLEEEAEFSCDAWVTWLFPQQRRAYAEALLHAKVVLGTTSHSVPASGIGVMSGRASRLARRIKMVMIGSGRPGLSATSIAMVALVGCL